jgi:hypothetical protein
MDIERNRVKERKKERKKRSLGMLKAGLNIPTLIHMCYNIILP